MNGADRVENDEVALEPFVAVSPFRSKRVFEERVHERTPLVVRKGIETAHEGGDVQGPPAPLSRYTLTS